MSKKDILKEANNWLGEDEDVSVPLKEEIVCSNDTNINITQEANKWLFEDEKEVVVNSHVVKKGTEEKPYWVVIQKVGNRVFRDTEHFSSRKEAIDAISELDKDLKSSIEKGFL